MYSQTDPVATQPFYKNVHMIVVAVVVVALVPGTLPV